MSISELVRSPHVKGIHRSGTCTGQQISDGRRPTNRECKKCGSRPGELYPSDLCQECVEHLASLRGKEFDRMYHKWIVMGNPMFGGH